MLVAFTFRAKPGKEREFEDLLRDPEAGRRIAALMGATRNTLLLKDGRMVRILEFPEGARPPPMQELARQHPPVMAFLERIAPLIEDGFDPHDAASVDAFNKRSTLALAYDVRP